jgi:hypothetical protein
MIENIEVPQIMYFVCAYLVGVRCILNFFIESM